MQNGIPVGLRSSPSFGLSRSGQLTAIIQSLFWDGSQGWWYDDDDLTTLFQDSAGTTPVTAVEQFVGLQLDKSKGGVGTNGTRRVNLLTYTEQFDNAAWGKSDATVTANATTAPDGTLTADLWSNTATGYPSVFQTSVPVSANATYVLSVYTKAATHNVVSLELRFAAGDNTLVDATYNLTTLAVTTFAAGATATCTDVGNGWRRLTLTRTNPSSGTTAIAIIGGSAINTGNVLSTGLTFYVWGADLRLAADANVSPTYQRITDTWYNTLPGNHRYAPASGNRPIWSKRVNLLTKTEQFDDAAWTKIATTVTANSTLAPNGTLTADTLTSTGNYPNAQQDISAAAGNLFTFRYSIRKTTGVADGSLPTVSVEFRTALTGLTEYGAVVNTNTGQLVAASGWGTAGFSSSSIVSDGDYWTVTCTTPAAPATTTIARLYVGISGGFANGTRRTVAFPLVSIIVWGADLRPANQATGLIPLYQRVNTSSDYDTNGFPGYFKADGVDDFLQTNTINFTATDKITLCAGVRKLSDATTGMVSELSANFSNGSFFLSAPSSNTVPGYTFASRGTAFTTATVSAGYVAPITNVLSGVGDISGDSVILRANGSTIATNYGDQGTGNFGNYPAYFFQRNGPPATFRFNGYEYGNIAVGKLLTADQLTALETYMNGLTKAY